MTLDEIRKGEHESIEYKQDIPLDKDKYLKTAVAFANGGGGRLVFGVENNTWEVTGFSEDEVFQKMDAITNSIFDSCEPRIVPIMGVQQVDGKQIIVAMIRSGMEKPYYLKRDGMMDGTYIRVAGVTRKAEPSTIRELQLEGANRSFDTLPSQGTVSADDIAALCDRLYDHALSLCRTEEQRRDQKKVTASQLVKWKILIQEGDVFHPTNAWELLTGNQEAFPDASIQCAVFKGTTRKTFVARREMIGPVDLQVEDALIFVKEHINLGSRIEGAYREDFYELPIDSIREMISNAVCHRSYLTPGKVQVAIFDDRFEVTSPGRISDELTIEQMIEGNSRIRNMALAAAFQYMHVIENWGTGIPRIFEDAAAYGLGRPELKNFGTTFRITIARRPFDTDQYGVLNPEKRHLSTENGGINEDTACANDGEDGVANFQNGGISGEITSRNGGINNQQTENGGINEDRIQRILNAISSDPEITLVRLAEITEIPKTSLERYIRELKNSGCLSREGARKNGHWVLH